jgi:apolipoprotein D and lipocalin family protein
MAQVRRTHNIEQRNCQGGRCQGAQYKVKVTFFWPFSENYWIIGLDPNYQWAVVGEPGRKYFWILSRQPHLNNATHNQIVERAKRRGYDLTHLRKTPQS